MQPEEVLWIIDRLGERGLRVWLDGGWGVDALLGEVTRSHEDVDLVIELLALSDVIEALESLGLSVSENLAPVRVVLTSADGRRADLHPVTFVEDGTGWQSGASPDGSDCPYPPEGFTEGHILDIVVPCISPELQLEHHSGYEPRNRDRQDMALLSGRFGLTLPDRY